MIDLSYQLRTLKSSEEEEAFFYHTLMDAKELIELVGIKGFLESLYAEEKGRALTIEEMEAMQVLHDNWEL